MLGFGPSHGRVLHRSIRRAVRRAHLRHVRLRGARVVRRRLAPESCRSRAGCRTCRRCRPRTCWRSSPTRSTSTVRRPCSTRAVRDISSLRERLIPLMADEGVEADPDDMVITTGAQQALDLIGKIFIDPGDLIAVEAPAYVGALTAFGAYQPRYLQIDLDDGRHDRRPARGGAGARRAPEVRLHRAELRQPRRRDDVAPPPPAARRAVPRGRHPDHRGQPVRAAPVRGRCAPLPALDGSRERDLPRHGLEGLLPGRPRRMGARRTERRATPGAGEGGGRPVRVVVHHARDRAVLRRRSVARRTSSTFVDLVPAPPRRHARGVARALPVRRHVDAPGGRLLRLGHLARMG